MSLRVLALLTALAVPLQAYLDVFTSTGDLLRTYTGTTWQRVANLGYSNGVAYVITPAGDAYFLTQHGRILRSQDQGHTWTALVNLSVTDAVDLLQDSSQGNWFLLTASGDVYRGTAVQNLTLLANVGGRNCVALVEERGSSSALVVVTRQGDVYRSTTHGTAWQRVGNVGMANIVDLTADVDTLQVLTETGDLWRSTDHGATWTLWSTVSQVGSRALLADQAGYLFLVDQTGALARYLGGAWNWIGTAGQVFVQGMAASGIPTLVEEDSSTAVQEWRLFPNPSPGFFFLRAPFYPVKFQVFDVRGRRVTRGTVWGSKSRIDLHWLPAGVYWVQCGFQQLRWVRQ